MARLGLVSFSPSREACNLTAGNSPTARSAGQPASGMVDDSCLDSRCLTAQPAVSFKLCCSVSCFAGIAARRPGTRVRPAGHTNNFPPLIHPDSLVRPTARCVNHHSFQNSNWIIHSTFNKHSAVYHHCRPVVHPSALICGGELQHTQSIPFDSDPREQGKALDFLAVG